MTSAVVALPIDWTVTLMLSESETKTIEPLPADRSVIRVSPKLPAGVHELPSGLTSAWVKIVPRELISMFSDF